VLERRHERIRFPSSRSPPKGRGEAPHVATFPVGEAGWQHVSRDPEKPGIRARVGINHLPLAALLNAALESGLALTELAEPGDTDPPLFLGFRAVKS